MIHRHGTAKTRSFLEIIAIFIFLWGGCKHAHSGDSSLFSYTDSAIDTIIIGSETLATPSACTANIFNIYADAADNALLLNGAMTGLGTDYPMGKKLATDGFYYQCLRIYSFFDWNIAEELKSSTATNRCLPEKVRFVYGVFNKDTVRNMNHPHQADVDKFRKAMGILFSSPVNFDLVSSDNLDAPAMWPRRTTLSPNLVSSNLDGTIRKLTYTRTTSSQNFDVTEKLKAMLAANNPLSMFFSADFPQGAPSSGRMLLEAYLPPMHDFDIPDASTPSSWTMTEGTRRYELPKQIDISVARLTHVGYLYENSADRYPLIKLEMYKDLAVPNLIKTRVTFGELSTDNDTPGMLPVSSKNFRNTLYIGFYPNFSVNDGDSAVQRTAKQQFNAIFNGFKIDARIHRLSLDLNRLPSSGTSALFPDLTVLHPHFDMKDSEISFRVHRYLNDTTEITAFKALGFACEAADTAGNVDCHLDMATQSDLSDFFTNQNTALAGTSFKSRLAAALRAAFSYAVSTNTKLIINWNSATIEQAIDQEFLKLFEILMDKQVNVRERIRARLDQEIFRP